MAVRFRKSVKICKGVKVNFSKSGASLSLGGRGHGMTFGGSGTHAHIGIPGTGLSYNTRTGGHSRSHSHSRSSSRSTSSKPTVQVPKQIGIRMDEKGRVVIADGNGVEITNQAVLRKIKATAQYQAQVAQLDAQRREKIDEMVREAEAENERFINICELSAIVDPLSRFQARLDEIHPAEYVMAKFDVPAPTKEKIKEFLTKEAATTVKGSIFKIGKLRRQYVEENLEQRYSNAFSAWEAERDDFYAFQEEEKLAADESAAEECEQQKSFLLSLIEGNESAVCEVFDSWISTCELPVEINISYDWNQRTGTMLLDVDLPEIEDFLENHGFNVEVSDNDNSCVEIQQYTPTDGDWSEIITISEDATVGDFLKEIEDLYEGYNVKEEVKMYLNADLDGTPDADDLVEDIKWRENVLKEMTEDTSLDEIYRMSAHTFSLTDTLPSRSFTLDESSLETGTENGKSYVEYLVEVWTEDETGRDFYDDIYERGEMWRVMEERCETFEELKANEGYEDAAMDVYVKVYEDHSAALSAVLKDNDGAEYTRDMLLDESEATAIYDVVENCLSKDRLEELFAEEREYATKEKDEYNNTLIQFAEDNFYDREDIIRTYMSFAPLQEIINFTDEPDVTMSNYRDAVNETIGNMSNTEIDNYADKYLEIMYQKNIKGEKYLDNLDTPAMSDSRAETARNTKEITDD